MTSYYTRAKARGEVEHEDVEEGDAVLETTTTTVSDIATVGLQGVSTEGLESMSAEVAGPVTTHPNCCQRETIPPWVDMEFWGLPALP